MWRRSLLLSLICVCSPAFGGIRPSFSLEYSTWHASDVVVVETTATGGIFQVVESWKGSLPVGERIAIPELRPLPKADPIALYPKSWPFQGPGAEQVPRQPVGSRIVLFLSRPIAGQSFTNTAQPTEWKPSDLMESMRASVLWLDNGEVYCFLQNVNPGPSTLSPCNYSEADLRRRFADINALREGFEQAMAVSDVAGRAERLKAYVRSEVFVIRFSALQELSKCGPAAAPTIQAMLDDAAFVHERAELIKALADAGGLSVGEDLQSRLKEDLAFWKSAAPSLSQGWWNQDVTPHAPLRERYSQTMELIEALRQIRYSAARETVTQVRQFWMSQPQLNDPSGLNQMVEACDKVLTQLPSK